MTTIDATDSARKLAEENGIDLTTIKGTGANGRIIKPDVDAAISAVAAATVQPPVDDGPSDVADDPALETDNAPPPSGDASPDEVVDDAPPDPALETDAALPSSDDASAPDDIEAEPDEQEDAQPAEDWRTAVPADTPVWVKLTGADTAMLGTRAVLRNEVHQVPFNVLVRAHDVNPGIWSVKLADGQFKQVTS
ncbi:MAG: hypothetical protein GY943_16730 [Chloroflexi bacterium]|nr:hypothetical protein [Chloroflexota bacterium]